jgi:hypothetical protein
MEALLAFPIFFLEISGGPPQFPAFMHLQPILDSNKLGLEAVPRARLWMLRFLMK